MLANVRAKGASNATTAPHTVRRGETLWGICTTALRKQGDEPTDREVHEAVQKVARANGLVDPDLIRTGQVLDVGAIENRANTVPPLVPSGTLNRTAADVRFPSARYVLRPASLSPPTALKASSVVGLGILGKPARVSSAYGFRKDPFTGRREHHDGVDLAVPSGTPIYPYDEGLVVFAGHKRGYGNTVVVRHGEGLETVYAHNSTNLVRAGQRATPDLPLGLSGSTGRSTGPHLHFEVRLDGSPVNPGPYLARESNSLQVAKAL